MGKPIILTLPLRVIIFTQRYIPHPKVCLLSDNYDELLDGLYNYIITYGESEYLYKNYRYVKLQNEFGSVAEEIYEIVWLHKYAPDEAEYVRNAAYKKYLGKIYKYYRGRLKNPPKPYSFKTRPKTILMLPVYEKLLKKKGLPPDYNMEKEEDTYDAKQARRVKYLLELDTKNNMAKAHNKKVYQYFAEKVGVDYDEIKDDLEKLINPPVTKYFSPNTQVGYYDYNTGSVVDQIERDKQKLIENEDYYYEKYIKKK